MSEQQNVELVKKGYDAFGRGDIDGLLALFDEQIEWTTPGPLDLPSAGRRHGHREVADFFGVLNDLFEFQRFEPKTFVAQGDVVVVLGEDTVRIKAARSVHDFEWAHVFQVRNGKVATFREYGDVTPVVLALRAAREAV